MSVQPGRRRFLGTTLLGGGSLVIGLHLPGLLPLAIADAPVAGGFRPNAFVEINEDGEIVLYVAQAEMGQGVLTSLPMLLAEELDVELSQVRIQRVGVNPAFNHPYFNAQVTGGSTSVRGFFEPLRRAGAQARQMLMEAAAERLEVPRESLRTESGSVIDTASGRRLAYAELAAAAAKLPVPDAAAVALKPASEFRLIGKGQARIEAPGKVDGSAGFGLDVRLPGMLTAVVAWPPVPGATLKSFDATAAKAVPGVVKVKQVPEGVAVIARDFWTARKGRDALRLEWDDGANAAFDSEIQGREYAELASRPGALAVERGDGDRPLEGAEGVIELDVEVPYLAHATMEPLNATVHHKGDSAEIWTGTQMPGADAARAAGLLGVAVDKVVLHPQLLGGGFGRRANPVSDFVAVAANVAKGEGLPVKTVYTREDDTRGGWYRPRALHRMRLALGENGLPKTWQHRVVAQSIMQGTPFESMGVKDGVDFSVVEGVIDLPYAVPNLRVECILAPRVLPVLWWRSVGHTHTALAVEHLVDVAARKAGVDPLDYRRRLLSEHPRWLAVLEQAAARSDWGKPLQEGHARGFAIHKSFETIVAQVAEVSIKGGRPRLHRVTAVADMGRVINPRHARVQIESGIVFGLSAALHQQITFAEGRVQQSNFHDFPLLRQSEMPRIEVHLVDSAEAPGGAGEPGTPPIAAALANALLALTGKPVRSLPVRLG
ncbi:xanthine dehydrogenase family protein molybdopterin-binding subunit [Pseudomarimonas salicorniae]|uniref:Molybdopterin-dependent oxidoreductase n=1 Tax=Pseudomarimonas salicorniae TaxID=2933270 RepID=A0ABT0GFH1_9GAMM|nr:molybdopterin cofactor-binding domain-containing protein [Lysobacter sp. CAU 1642]MCK7593290.1 molybdopterin-dependent oxidoreductase [Lysobacter sp. CAU 1642]